MCGVCVVYVCDIVTHLALHHAEKLIKINLTYKAIINVTRRVSCMIHGMHDTHCVCGVIISLDA